MSEVGEPSRQTETARSPLVKTMRALALELYGHAHARPSHREGTNREKENMERENRCDYSLRTGKDHFSNQPTSIEPIHSFDPTNDFSRILLSRHICNDSGPTHTGAVGELSGKRGIKESTEDPWHFATGKKKGTPKNEESQLQKRDRKLPGKYGVNTPVVFRGAWGS